MDLEAKYKMPMFVLAHHFLSMHHYSCSERHPHPPAVGDAQLFSPEALGPHHLPHRGGCDQCERQGGRAADVVHGHQSHTGPTEEC